MLLFNALIDCCGEQVKEAFDDDDDWLLPPLKGFSESSKLLGQNSIIKKLSYEGVIVHLMCSVLLVSDQLIYLIQHFYSLKKLKPIIE